jgi:hypothetical protein
MTQHVVHNIVQFLLCSLATPMRYSGKEVEEVMTNGACRWRSFLRGPVHTLDIQSLMRAMLSNWSRFACQCTSRQGRGALLFASYGPDDLCIGTLSTWKSRHQCRDQLITRAPGEKEKAVCLVYTIVSLMKQHCISSFIDLTRARGHVNQQQYQKSSISFCIFTRILRTQELEDSPKEICC